MGTGPSTTGVGTNPSTTEVGTNPSTTEVGTGPEMGIDLEKDTIPGEDINPEVEGIDLEEDIVQAAATGCINLRVLDIVLREDTVLREAVSPGVVDIDP